MRSHAIANSLHVVAVNRVGKEDELIFGDNLLFVTLLEK